jgi:DNA-directed RNA polymerase subunit RPC12/RpoP
MPIEIIIDGRPLPPEKAVGRLLPVDTPLACPACNSQRVGAGRPRTGIRLDGEAQHFIPRQQDRWCEDCGHRWMTVLPPAIIANPEFTGGSR